MNNVSFVHIIQSTEQVLHEQRRVAFRIEFYTDQRVKQITALKSTDAFQSNQPRLRRDMYHLDAFHHNKEMAITVEEIEKFYDVRVIKALHYTDFIFNHVDLKNNPLTGNKH